ncbi:acetate/propionate family kinase [Haliea sp. E1-2-M8]|uniref:acetate/propionate family kinase n=1 Tax=Haliea sp. E1-2-M8 TaxID=3064706 RepID=UPI00271F113D|nr:acetate/propionate family kinase [Haliea sp. E1-2-M8]MDO8860914.1 acetate/propionate family kinase [Haliea sp. E1-2-M8]
MLILVLNSGSSTLKYSVVDSCSKRSLRHEVAEWTVADGQAPPPLPDLDFADAGAPVAAVAHRVVHGGPGSSGPAELTEATLRAIEQATVLAPLHNEPALAVIRHAFARYPGLPQVAVFDTAFHHDLPEHARRYAVPEHWYQQHGLHRYGFHGISHASVAQQAAAFLQRPPADLRLITLHLGNGASASAIAGGRSIDTSMGMTPLEGLVMGTRGGDLDIGAALHVARREGLNPNQLEQVLTRDSGLAGLCGDSDMRAILARCEQGDSRAQLALSVYCYRIRKYIGAYFAALGGLDALVFTGGVGENAAAVRASACEGLTALGIAVDSQKNALTSTDRPRAIQAEESAVAVLVIPSHEDLEIARQTQDFLAQR